MIVSGDDELPIRVRGVDLHVADDEAVVFAGYIEGVTMTPGGELKVRMAVPFVHVPLVFPVLRQVGGIVFEVTMRRVPVDQLPGPAW